MQNPGKYFKEIPASKALKSLLTLIYSGNLFEPKNKWVWPQIRKGVDNFLTDVTGKVCKYDESKDRHIIHFFEGTEDNGGTQWKFYEVNENHLSSLVRIMQALRTEIIHERYIHLYLVKVVDKAVTSLEADYPNALVYEDIELPDDETLKRMIEKGVTTFGPYTAKVVDRKNILIELPGGEVIFKWGVHGIKRALNLADNALIRGNREKRYHSRLKDNEIIASSNYQRILYVRIIPNSDFCPKYLFTKKHLYLEKFLPSEDPDLIAKVPFFAPLDIFSFVQIVRALLVKFHLDFESFKRLKICKNAECEKLFFDEREGRGRFCSDPCRRKGDPNVRERRKCRDKHAKRADRQYERLPAEIHDALNLPESYKFALPGKEDCEKCKDFEKGTDCPAFFEKNKPILSKIDSLKKDLEGRSRISALKRKEAISS